MDHFWRLRHEKQGKGMKKQRHEKINRKEQASLEFCEGRILDMWEIHPSITDEELLARIKKMCRGSKIEVEAFSTYEQALAHVVEVLGHAGLSV